MTGTVMTYKEMIEEYESHETVSLEDQFSVQELFLALSLFQSPHFKVESFPVNCAAVIIFEAHDGR